MMMTTPGVTWSQADAYAGSIAIAARQIADSDNLTDADVDLLRSVDRDLWSLIDDHADMDDAS